MNTTLIVLGVGAIIFSLLFAAGLFYYVSIALKKRVALGLGWHFDRDDRPFLFWLQIVAVAAAGLNQLAKTGTAASALVGMM